MFGVGDLVEADGLVVFCELAVDEDVPELGRQGIGGVHEWAVLEVEMDVGLASVAGVATKA